MANFIVTTLEDETVSGAETVASPDGAGLSLREALALTLANGSNTADTITFAPGLAGGTISLTAFQQLTVAGNVTIDGDLNDDGQADITIARPSVGLPPLHAGQFRVLEVDAGSVTLEGLKITNGNAGDHAFGHGILATAGAHLTILQSEIFGNGNHDIASAGGGLGITAGAEVTIIASNIHHNNAKANGAGISNFGGTLNIFDSTISANQTDSNGADLYAGGIFSEGNTTVTNSTIANNVGGDGAGISHLSGTLRLTNVTLWANDSPNHRAEGAGLYVGAGSEAILTNVTVTGNRAGATGGGIAAYGHVTLTNSIVTGNMQGLANG